MSILFLVLQWFEVFFQFYSTLMKLFADFLNENMQNLSIQTCVNVVCTQLPTAQGNSHGKALSTTRQCHHSKSGQCIIWCYTEASGQEKKTVQINPHPLSVSPLGQGRAEPQAQAWRGCCQLLKMQETALPGLVSLTLFRLHTNILGTSICTEHTGHRGLLHWPLTVYQKLYVRYFSIHLFCLTKKDT